jgi:aminopeptidase N
VRLPRPRTRARRAGVALTLASIVAIGAVSSGAGAGVRARPGPGTLDTPDPYYPTLGNRGYDVDHYDVGITYAPPDREIEGDTKIKATATRPLTKLHLDLSGLDVRRIEVDGSHARFSRQGDELIIRPAVPIKDDATFTVRVRYDGVPEPNEIPGLGAANGWLETEDGATTLDEPDGASTWFPANDHPQDKATFTFRITVPDELEAVANGDLTQKFPSSDADMTTWVWSNTGLMTTYLTQLAIGDLVLVDAEPVDGVKIRNAYAPGLQDQVESAVQDTPAMLRFLTAQLGPYPFDTYGILVPEGGPSGLAFEAQTFSLFSSDIMSDGGDGPSAVMAHELAHQWFGDWVSPATWSETWLNEGFATYYEWLWTAEALGVPLDASVERARRLVSQSAVDVATDDPGIEGMFGVAPYERGALTIDALARTVGPEQFSTIIATYLEKYGDSVATTEDLIKVVSDVTGEDMEPFFRAWLGPGPLPDRP